MAPPWVVKRLDIIEDGKLRFAACGGLVLVQAGVTFEAAPERFHGSVVVAIFSATHAAGRSGGEESCEVVGVNLLGSTIRMMQPSFRGLTLPQGGLQGRQSQAGVQGGSARPAHCATAPGIEDGGQENPAFSGFQMGDFGPPDPIGAGRRGGLREQVGRHRPGMAAVGRAWASSVLPFAAQALGAHQPGAAALACARAGLLQILEDSRNSIRSTTGLVRDRNLTTNRRILALPTARPVLLTTVAAARRHLQQFAQHSHGLLALHRFDLGIPFAGVSDSSPIAFFRGSSGNGHVRKAKSRILTFGQCCQIAVLLPHFQSFLHS